MREDVRMRQDHDAFFRIKLAHAQLNRSDLLRAAEKRLEKIDKKFLNEDIDENIGPWNSIDRNQLLR